MSNSVAKDEFEKVTEQVEETTDSSMDLPFLPSIIDSTETKLDDLPEFISETDDYDQIAQEQAIAQPPSLQLIKEEEEEEEEDSISDEIPSFIPENTHDHQMPDYTSASHDDKLNDLLTTYQEALKPLKSIEKKLEQLDHLSKIDELHRLEALSELAALDQLINLKSLEHLDKLEGLDKLQNLEKLDLINNDKFFKKLENLDKLSILNKKFTTVVISQFIGLFLDLLKFGTATALVFFLLTSELGRRFTAESLSAVGFGSPAQSSLGLLLLQGRVEEPKFYEIIENVRNKIKTELNSALSTGNTLALSQRAKILEEILTYNYQYKEIDLKQEAHNLAKKQILEAKILVLPKIQFDIAIAQSHGNKALENDLKEVKTLFINENYIEILSKFKFTKLKEESVRLATIVATLELQLEDPKTLQQVIVP